MRVAIVGGTGRFGVALARRLVASGDDVVIGSRDPERARAAAAAVGAAGATNADAVAGADVVVLAVDGSAAVDAARALRAAIGRTPVLCVANDLGAGERSVAERVAAAVDAPVAAGLHTVAAARLDAEQDTLVCGDEEAKRVALDVARRAVAGRPVDAGPLENARVLEGLTRVLIAVNRRYRAHTGIRVTGL